MCGVDGSPGVVGRGNGGGGGGLYKVYPCCKKSLGTQLSNIIIKLKNCILKDSYQRIAGSASGFAASPCDIATFYHFCHPGFSRTDWTRKCRKNATVGHKSHTVHHPIAQSKPAIKVSILN
jgi:hypothetical protein